MKVIKNGEVIDPASAIEGAFDLLIDKDRIVGIEKRGAFDSTGNIEEIIDASGNWIIPGLIDLHVHLREPGYEWKETIQSGSEAAVLGGFTSLCCMPNTKPTNDCAEVTKFILSKGKEAELARIFPIGSVTINLEGKTMSPLSELRKAGCVAFSDDGEPVYNSGMMRRALEWASMLDATICCHEEDKHLSCGGSMNESHLSSKLGLKGWPAVAEEVMIARDIELARVTNARVHFCHVTTARGAELLRRAKNDGIKVSGEVTPHHLVMTEEAVADYDTNAKMSPPLRSQEDCDKLLEAVIDGTIDAVASDHAPHELDSKAVEFGRASFGILGLQTSLPIMLEFVRSKKISLRRAIEVLSSSAAKLLKLDVGTLKKGALADIVVLDPNKKWNFERSNNHSLSQNSPFLGKTMQGACQVVLVGGRVVVMDGMLSDRKVNR